MELNDSSNVSRKCPRCNREVNIGNARYCPYCRASLNKAKDDNSLDDIENPTKVAMKAFFTLGFFMGACEYFIHSTTLVYTEFLGSVFCVGVLFLFLGLFAYVASAMMDEEENKFLRWGRFVIMLVIVVIIAKYVAKELF